MNAIFAFLILFSAAALMLTTPELLLPTALEGGTAALNLTLKMTAIYAFWMGILGVAKETKLMEKLAKLLHPLIRFLFGPLPSDTEHFVATNLSANFLGMGNAATPMGIRAIQSMHGGSTKATFPMIMLFCLNASGMQLIPSSVISLRAACGSASPSDILLPIFLTDLLSTFVSVILVKTFVRREAQ